MIKLAKYLLFLLVMFATTSCGYQQDINSIDAFKLEIIDEDNHIINKSLAIDTRYAPGTLLKFYANPITNANLLMYENNQFFDKQHTIQQEDECLWLFSYVMPAYDVVLKFEVETIEYLTLKNVLNIPSISSENIVKVRKEKGYIGVAPGSLTNIEYSTDVDDINNVLSILEMPVYEETTNIWQITGGGYNCYSIITNQEKHDIYISNGYIYANEKHYKFEGDYIKFNNVCLEAHSYTTYQDVFDAYTMDDQKLGSYEGLSKFEFIDYPYDTVPENENLGYLSTEIGPLYILTEDIFYTKKGNNYIYFLIVGEKNFGYIFK